MRSSLLAAILFACLFVLGPDSSAQPRMMDTGKFWELVESAKKTQPKKRIYRNDFKQRSKNFLQSKSESLISFSIN